MGHQTEHRTKRTTFDKGHLLTLNTAHFIATAVARQEDILTSYMCVCMCVRACMYVWVCVRAIHLLCNANHRCGQQGGHFFLLLLTDYTTHGSDDVGESTSLFLDLFSPHAVLNQLVRRFVTLFTR